jgi:hypothetical protein
MVYRLGDEPSRPAPAGKMLFTVQTGASATVEADDERARRRSATGLGTLGNLGRRRPRSDGAGGDDPRLAVAGCATGAPCSARGVARSAGGDSGAV